VEIGHSVAMERNEVRVGYLVTALDEMVDRVTSGLAA
jgi:hypothetical protein